MSTLGVFSITVGYHDKCGGRSLGKQLKLYGNSDVLNIHQYTNDIPHTHLGIPHAHHGIPRCTEQPPVYCTDIIEWLTLSARALITCIQAQHYLSIMTSYNYVSCIQAFSLLRQDAVDTICKSITCIQARHYCSINQ